MSGLKMHIVEGGIDQFQAEGDQDTVLRLLAEWYVRSDVARAEATRLVQQQMERAAQAGIGMQQPPPTAGPVGPGGNLRPFVRPRTS